MAQEYTGEVIPVQSGAQEYNGPVIPTGPVMRPDPKLARGREAALGRAAEAVSLRDPSVDYSREIEDFAFRAGFGRMSTDAERRNYLNQSVGAGNYDTDAYGRYFIKPEGLQKLGIQSDKPIVMDKPGASRYDLADYAGDLPAIAGGLAGSLAATGAGMLPGMGLAALGAAGGKAIDELVKQGQGLNIQTAPEQIKTLAGTAFESGMGEGLGRQIVGAGRIMAAPYSRFADPQRQQLTREALDAGLLPKVFQIQPRGKLLSRFQTMGENVLGDAARARNEAALQAGADRLIGVAGRDAPQNAERIISGVTGYADDLGRQATNARQAAQTQLNQSLSTIQRDLGSPDPNVGSMVQERIKAERTKFGQAATKLYQEVDSLVGGKPIVPTAPIKAQLNEFLKDLPTDNAGEKIFPTPELKQFFAKYGDIADMQTTAQMQQLRTDFRTASESTNLVPGVDKYRARKLKDSVDKAFDDALQKAQTPQMGSDMSGFTDPQVTQALTKLREADEFYKSGIRKFDAPSIAAITRDASRAGAVEPDRVIDYMIRPGHTSSVMRVKSILPQQEWQKITRAHFDNLISDSTRLIDGAETISGPTLLNNINKMGKTFDAVYGKNAAQIKEYAKSLAARDGKLDPALLTGDIAQNIKTAIAKETELKKFLSENYLSQLAKPGAEAQQAVGFIFRPQSPQRIELAKKFYGENSEVFKGLQNDAARILFSDFVKVGEDPLTKIFDGAALRSALDKYGRETLNAAFGRQWTDDAYKFANVAQFVTQKNPNSSGLVSAMVALNPIRHIWKILDIAGTTYLLRQPGVLKWLSEGLQTGNKAAAAGALARVAAVATSIAEDKTASGPLDMKKMKQQ